MVMTKAKRIIFIRVTYRYLTIDFSALELCRHSVDTPRDKRKNFIRHEPRRSVRSGSRSKGRPTCITVRYDESEAFLRLAH